MKISLIRPSSLIISAGQNEFTNKSPGLNGENTVYTIYIFYVWNYPIFGAWR